MDSIIPAGHKYQRLLEQLVGFVYQERDVATARRLASWERPMRDKLKAGVAQQFTRLEPGPEANLIRAWPAKGESRFREGDQLCLHRGSPFADPVARQLTFEAEDEHCWILRGRKAAAILADFGPGPCYAEEDAIDLTSMFTQALNEVAHSSHASSVILPLLEGKLAFEYDARDDDEAQRLATAQGLNARQAEAVARAYSAHHVACIQGPPGTGKTKVLALAVSMMAARGERVLVTSHTHTAINHALVKIAALGAATVKIGGIDQLRGLDSRVERAERFDQWETRPASGGYVVGATPFASCTARLAQIRFDTVVFDEASQITVPLALMAMRCGKRFVFIGDQRQLPPVVLSASVLNGAASVFARLTSGNEDGVMLRETYRMNRWLTAWPSRSFYDGELTAAGPNAERTLALSLGGDTSFAATILQADASAVFIPTLNLAARAQNLADAALVADLCACAHAGGLALAQIGIVTPYRAQGRAIRTLLSERFGAKNARAIVADTVERMQGQEREIIIVSLATGDLSYLAAVASFFFQRERLNVSVTRAMTKLIIIGPEIPAQFSSDEPELARDIGLYRELLASCARMPAPS